MAWIEPIFDRTQADIDYAIRMLREWKENPSATPFDLKGCFNFNDINRIEGNIKYLSEELTSLYYFSNITSKTWGRGALTVTPSEINRIRGNITILLNSFFKDEKAPTIPDTLLTFQQVNDLEYNLYLIKQMLDNMVASFKECGVAECGEE